MQITYFIIHIPIFFWVFFVVFALRESLMNDVFEFMLITNVRSLASMCVGHA